MDGKNWMPRLWGFFCDLSTGKRLLIAMVLYTCVFSWFSLMKHSMTPHGDPDLGVFGQSMWTTLSYGDFLYNSFEPGTHFRVHFSPILFLLLPFYALHPEVSTLIVLQTAALAAGAWPVFLLARLKFSEESAMKFACLYLLYHPLHGMNFDPFHENAFMVAPLLFALYFMETEKWRWFWLSMAVVLSCKEEMGFLAAFLGLYGMGRALWEGRGKWCPGKGKLFFNSLGLSVVGALFSIIVIGWLAPWIRDGVDYHFFRERYGYMGDSCKEVFVTMATRPLVPLQALCNLEKIGYVLEIFMPLAFLSWWAPWLLVPLIPPMAANLLSTFGAMHNTGMRYMAPIIPFVFSSAIGGLAKVLATRKPPDREKAERRWFMAAFVLTMACMFTLDLSPCSLLRPGPAMTPHHRIVREAADRIPDEVTVATHSGIYQYLTHRRHVSFTYQQGVEYIIVDRSSPWFKDSLWERDLSYVLKRGDYEVLEERDGIVLLKKHLR
jgi:uncharacterized membrane protein